MPDTQLIDLDEMSLEEVTSFIKTAQDKKRSLADAARLAKGPTKRGRGILETAKRILYANPNISLDNLYKEVSDKCGKCSLSVLQTVKSDFFNTMRVLEELGALKEKKVETAPKNNSRPQIVPPPPNAA
jgi:hypothetical protein